MERHTIVGALLFAIVATCGDARAQQDERRFALAWSAPSGCPDAAAVEAQILRLAGREPSIPMQVRATITRDGERFRIALATSSAAGEGARTIEGASCESVADAGALVIAMAIDPEAALRSVERAETGEETEAEAEAETETETEAEARAGQTETEIRADAFGSVAEVGSALATPSGVARAPELARTSASASAPAFSFLASAHATLGIGPLPAPAPGAAVALGVRVEPIELWLGASFLAEQGASVDGYGASFLQATGRVRACVPIALGTPVVELAPCGGVELGAIQGTPARDVPRRATGTSWWSALEVLVDARAWVLRELGITLFGGIEIPLVIERFVVSAPGAPRVLHRPADVAFLGGVGLVVRVP